MGSLILCHKKKAKQPYEIARVHMYIYTIEELCYYICNNLYLVDHTIINMQLCDWIGNELELPELGEKLHQELAQSHSEEQFILTVLKGSMIYAPSEITKIQNLLDQLRNQNEVERQKYKADSLFSSGEYASAILVYQAILNQEWDDSLKKTFYGRIYACLGAAYGRLLLYEEAADMYREALELYDDPDILKAFLYSCFRAYPQEKYMKMLSGNVTYLSANSSLREEIKRNQRGLDLDMDESRLEVWKKEYRRIDKSR